MCVPISQDLGGARTAAQIAADLDLGSPAFDKRHWHIVPCSAYSGAGLVEGIDWLVQDISQRIFLAE